MVSDAIETTHRGKAARYQGEGTGTADLERGVFITIRYVPAERWSLRWL